MPARRFFVEGVHAIGGVVVLAGTDAHKVRNVLRLRNGDTIELTDSTGRTFEATLCEHPGRSEAASREAPQPHGPLQAHLVRELTAPSSRRVSIDLAQAIPKGPKMDFVVEKATELGVAGIIPFTSERTVPRNPGDAKLDRWRRLARTASQQSGRVTIARIDAVERFEAICDRFARYDAVLFPWELAPQTPLRETLPALLETAQTVLIVIGPEGGFSHEEAQRAEAAGAHLLWLGPNIYRTETAGTVMLSILTYCLSSQP
jgi:16S rRNA (uracil1498-N3)-methyltransferase